MLERTIGELLNRYVFCDGVIKEVGLFLAVGNVTLSVIAPMLPGHPEYDQARMDRNFRQGHIYSEQDWRDVEIRFGKVENCITQLGSQPLVSDRIHTMPYELDIDRLELKLLSPAVASYSLEAEALYMSFRFEMLEYSES